MKRILLAIVAAAVLYGGVSYAVQAPARTPATIIAEIEALLAELKTSLATTDPTPTPPPPPTETCGADGYGDGIDNDGDGQVDEGCAPRPPDGVRVVTTAAELDAALLVGGTIKLEPGQYAGNFTVSVDGTTLLGVAGLPETRVTPEHVAAVLLTPADPYKAVLSIQASRVRVEGLTAMPARNDREVVLVGQLEATTSEAQPDAVVIDRVAVLAGEAGGVRGISLHTRGVTVTRSHVAGFWYRYRDSQAIWINNGPGPYTITDNYLEGSGENIMVGGDAIRIPNVVPSDILIARNTIYKPESWRTLYGSVKNSVELKAGRRVTIEDNLIDGNWKDAQGGDTIVLTPRNPSGGCPWIVVEDVVIRRNVVTRATQGYAVSILGTDNNHETQQTARVTVEHNLFADATGGFKILVGVAGHLIVRRNTFPAIAGNWFLFSGITVKTPLTAQWNVAKSGAYGISGSTTVGEPSLLAATEGAVFTDNVIEKYCCRTIKWPAGNTLLEPWALANVLTPVTFKHPDPLYGY